MEYFFVFCAAFVGSGLKAVGGFGFATLTTPTVSLFWDVPTAIVVISIPTLVTSFLNCWRTREAVKEGFSIFFPFFISSLIGLGFGLSILLNMNPNLMKLILGLYLVIQISWEHFNHSETNKKESTLTRSISMGGIAGLMLGTVGMPSHVIASYLTGMNLSKNRYLFILSSTQVILRVTTIAFLQSRLVGKEVIGLTVIMFIPVLLGFVVGTKIYKFLTDKIFFTIVKIIILLMGFALIIKYLTQYLN
mgnify:FL=1